MRKKKRYKIILYHNITIFFLINTIEFETYYVVIELMSFHSYHHYSILQFSHFLLESFWHKTVRYMGSILFLKHFPSRWEQFYSASSVWEHVTESLTQLSLSLARCLMLLTTLDKWDQQNARYVVVYHYFQEKKKSYLDNNFQFRAFTATG